MSLMNSQESPNPLDASSVQKSEAGIAIFDLDGTLTTRDSFLAFLITFGRRHSRYGSLTRLPLRCAAYKGKLIPDYRLKQDLIRDFLQHDDVELVAEHVRWFCQNWLPAKLHPVGTSLLKTHQKRGDRVIILSASPEIFVPAIAKSFGIDEVVCTRIKQHDGRWHGSIIGKNCKGTAKVDAIAAYLGVERAPANTYSYGDSGSDVHVLRWVQNGAWIRKDRFEFLQGSGVHDI